MENTPVKSPEAYKRYRSRSPLVELPRNGADVAIDPDEEVEVLTSAEKRRKRWSDQLLPKRQTRSSTASDSTNLKKGEVVASPAPLGKKGKDQEKEKGKGKVLERTPVKDKENVKGFEKTPRKDKGKAVDTSPSPRKHTAGTPASMKSPLWRAPLDFVAEKKAFFDEIDKFELESEEEELVAVKTTGKEMLSDSSGETISPESSKGETPVPSPVTGPEQSTQEVTTAPETSRGMRAAQTEETKSLASSKGETSVPSPVTGPEQTTQEVTTAAEPSRGEGQAQTGDTTSLAFSKGETSVPSPVTGLGQSIREVTTTAEASIGQRAAQSPNTMLEQSTEELTITVELGEKDDR